VGRILVKLHAFPRSSKSGILLFFLTLDPEVPHPPLSPRRGNPSSPPLSCRILPSSGGAPFFFPLLGVYVALIGSSDIWRSAILLPSPGGEGRVRGLFPGIVEETEQQSETDPRKMDPGPVYPGLSLSSPRTTHVERPQRPATGSSTKMRHSFRKTPCKKSRKFSLTYYLDCLSI